MLEAFIDDSEAQEDEQTLVLAGYVHFAKQWAIFSDEWAATLREAPSIEYFHMVDAWAFEGQFEGWNPEQRDAKVISLAQVISRHGPRSISIEVSRKDFREVYEPFAPYELRHPYFPCFHGVCVNLARWHAASGITVPVDFIFDEKGSIGLEAQMWYEEIKRRQVPEIQRLMGGPPIFRDDKKVAALQAADLLAWHLRRVKEERFKSEEHPALKTALGTEHCEVQIPRAMLEQWGQQMSQVPGIEFSRDKQGARRRQPELKTRLSLGLGPPLSGDDLIERPHKSGGSRPYRLSSLQKVRRLFSIVRRFLFRRRHN